MKSLITKKKAAKIIDSFPGTSVMVVGDVMVDHFIWGRVSRISPEAPVPVVEVARESQMLGGSANVLNNIVSAGGNALIAGVVGNDQMGRWLVGKLEDSGINAEGIVKEDRPTTVKTRIVAQSQQVVRFDRESKKPVLSSSVESILKFVESERERLGAIVVSDYNKGVVSAQLLDGLRRIAKGTGIVTCVDPKRSDLAFYRGLDVITPNHLEAEAAMGITDLNGQERGKEALIAKAAAELLEKCDFKCLIITRGERGMSLFARNGDSVHIPAMGKEVFDVTGAGDTVIGIFALSMAAGAGYREAAYLANKAAGIVVGKIGTATVTAEELKDSL
jgi:D-beta-D-heptose 7-phosphate kinase/D-beta-D-heptose 1-phosphate adenosyltransferase